MLEIRPLLLLTGWMKSFRVSCLQQQSDWYRYILCVSDCVIDFILSVPRCHKFGKMVSHLIHYDGFESSHGSNSHTEPSAVFCVRDLVWDFLVAISGLVQWSSSICTVWTQWWVLYSTAFFVSVHLFRSKDDCCILNLLWRTWKGTWSTWSISLSLVWVYTLNLMKLICGCISFLLDISLKHRVTKEEV